EHYRKPYLPVLLVTGLTDREQRKRGLQSGADDFLTKPVDDEELLLRTRAFLRLRTQDSLIRQQLKELAKMHLAKDEMTSLMVHDLRSPLAGIMAHLRLLLDDLPEGRSHDDVSAALRAADSMFGTLEEALQIRLLEEGHVDIRRKPVDLGEFVMRAVLILDAVEDRRKIGLVFSGERVRTVYTA